MYLYSKYCTCTTRRQNKNALPSISLQLIAILQYFDAQSRIVFCCSLQRWAGAGRGGLINGCSLLHGKVILHLLLLLHLLLHLLLLRLLLMEQLKQPASICNQLRLENCHLVEENISCKNKILLPLPFRLRALTRGEL